ncbi:DUF6518 family protein [Streptomyces sp. NPDC052687]|uniref:DUF6518 family protein n=1 Tax=Streptomyces sp. NPDC052687 TaxID=3154759 RepID=UPI00343F5729
MRSSFRSSLPRLTLVLGISVAVGILGPLLGPVSGSVSQIASATLSAGWAYAAVAYAAGMASRSKRGAAVLGVVSLWGCVTVYYLTKAAQGDYLKADLSDPTGKTEYFAWGELLSMIGLWAVFACLLGPVCAIAGKASLSGPWPLLSQLLLPAVVMVETTMRLAHPAPLQDQLVVTTWQVTRMLAIAAVVALVVRALWRGRASVRPAG